MKEHRPQQKLTYKQAPLTTGREQGNGKQRTARKAISQNEKKILK